MTRAHISKLHSLSLLICLAVIAGCALRSSDTKPPIAIILLDNNLPASMNRIPIVLRTFNKYLPLRNCGFYVHIEPYVNARLADGEHDTALIAGYLRLRSSLPLLRQDLLADRNIYGWEGPDPHQESSYMIDWQYPHQLAYIAAIEAITGRSVRQSVALTAIELAHLRSEASEGDITRIDTDFEKVQRGLCARWLLTKLGPPA